MPLAAYPKCFLKAMVAERTMSLDDWIAMAARLGVDRVEFHWGFTPATRAGREAVRAKLQAVNPTPHERKPLIGHQPF